MTALLSASSLTLILAPVIGAYLVLSGIGLLGKGAIAAFFDDLVRHPAALHAVGAVAFLAGAALVSFHRHWAHPAEIAVNLVGAYWAFEGGGMLASPDAVRRALLRPDAAATMRAATIPLMAVGLYLIVVGFAGHIG